MLKSRHQNSAEVLAGKHCGLDQSICIQMGKAIPRKAGERGS